VPPITQVCIQLSQTRPRVWIRGFSRCVPAQITPLKTPRHAPWSGLPVERFVQTSAGVFALFGGGPGSKRQRNAPATPRNPDFLRKGRPPSALHQAP